MEKINIDLLVGALLHDFGKLLYRYNDSRNHSLSGYEYLKEKLSDNKEILDQIRYHHYSNIKNAIIDDSSLSYITYIADNISASADRRKVESDAIGFSREVPLQSIFNLLNGKSSTYSYNAKLLTSDINYPTSDEILFSTEFYGKCVSQITDNLQAIDIDTTYINSLLEILEANLSYIPSSTSLNEVADISLFDHSKMTAAVADCIYNYLKSENITNYKEALFLNAKNFYDKQAFIIYSFDLSGIQDFIYNIESENALKMLRTRSFYLEIITETLIDNLLEKLGHSRANLIYSGGGHAYIISANTKETTSVIDEFESEANAWFLDTFKTDLYIGGGHSACSANNLKNEPQGSYKEIFKAISENISERKMNRYSAKEITSLNNQAFEQTERECSSCFRTDRLSDSGKCVLCDALASFSKKIQKGMFFTVVSKNDIKGSLSLPVNKYLISESKQELLKTIKTDYYIRSYSKNELYTGLNLSSNLWVGDFENGNSFEDFCKDTQGVKRLGVLRADVDNLGKAFVQGFENEDDKDYYVTLSRTATFSRKLSIFFKRHINAILNKGSYYITDEESGKRRASIVYSGGDDVFIVGEWADIIGFAVDLNNSLARFSQSKLSISAGIGIYPVKYPVSAMAREVGELEECAKNNKNKNSVALFSDGNVYTWSEFTNEVLAQKYAVINNFFSKTDKYGNSFLYKLLELLRNRDEKINVARYAYVLSRMRPSEKESDELKEAYAVFAEEMYKWMKNEKESRQAMTAIYIYVYAHRERNED